jgi:regulator of RNase E activity RraA
MTLTSINAPIRIGRATVLPGDLVLAKTDGVIFIPAILAEQAIVSAEFTNLAEFEGGWTPAKYDALARWIDEHPDKLKMSRAQFNSLLEKKKQPRP